MHRTMRNLDHLIVRAERGDLGAFWRWATITAGIMLTAVLAALVLTLFIIT